MLEWMDRLSLRTQCMHYHCCCCCCYGCLSFFPLIKSAAIDRTNQIEIMFRVYGWCFSFTLLSFILKFGHSNGGFGLVLLRSTESACTQTHTHELTTITAYLYLFLIWFGRRRRFLALPHWDRLILARINYLLCRQKPKTKQKQQTEIAVSQNIFEMRVCCLPLCAHNFAIQLNVLLLSRVRAHSTLFGQSKWFSPLRGHSKYRKEFRVIKYIAQHEVRWIILLESDGHRTEWKCSGNSDKDEN